jgi:hypothetical protein
MFNLAKVGTHTYNSSYSEGRDQEDYASNAKSLVRPYLIKEARYGGTHLLSQLLRRWRLEDCSPILAQTKHQTLSEKQTKSKKGLGHSSRGTAAEFKSQHHKTKQEQKWMLSLYTQRPLGSGCQNATKAYINPGLV